MLGIGVSNICRLVFRSASCGLNQKSVILSQRVFKTCFRSFSSADPGFRLESLGRLVTPHENSAYEPGQLILHRLFGYRGVILQSWPGKLFDKEAIAAKSIESKSNVGKENGQLVMYYLVLVDIRDLEYAGSSIKDGIMFLPENRKVVDSIDIMYGMDYVSQHDIIPYMPHEANPIKNQYFQEFLMYDSQRDPCYVPTERLRRWLHEKQLILELSTIHRTVTENVRVTAIPFYMGTRMIGENDEDIINYWRYTIRLENFGEQRVQLRERMWKMLFASGRLESIKGKGVVGVQPVLSRENPVFQYTSFTHHPSSYVHMWGSYVFEREAGTSVDVKIPAFLLHGRTKSNLSSAPFSSTPNLVDS